MGEGLIVARSMGELRKAAAEGQAYYSCERFEDAYGRLIVGIGARLEGRSLQMVVHEGRRKVFVSPVSLSDGIRFRRAFRQVDHHESRDAILEMYDSFSQVHPDAAKRILRLNPQPNDLTHGREVGTYVRRLMTAFNDVQNEGQFRYSKKDMMSGFVAGAVHDMGCWGGRRAQDHAKRGAQILRKLVKGSSWLQRLAGLVEAHHFLLATCLDKKVMQVAPLILSEAVVEGGNPVLYSLVGQGVSEPVKALLICLCNLEQCMPSLCVVRVRNLAGGLRFALAVSLKTEGGISPYLLRFAEVDGMGRPRPVSLEYRCLIGPGHPEFEAGDFEVVDVLSEGIYKRLFEAYEGLIPIYQKMMNDQRVDLQTA